MAAVAFDTLAYVRRIMAAGVPREQAKAQAEAMKEAFVHNVDALVTRDYLDTRFSEFQLRVEAGIDKRLLELESSMDVRFARVDVGFERVEGKFRLLFWMQGLVLASLVMPLLHDFLS